MNIFLAMRTFVSTAITFAATFAITADGFAVTPVTSPATRPADTALATLAVSMKPGEWRTFDTVGLTDSLRKAPPPSKGLDIMGWTDDAAWDSAGGQFVYMGLRQRRRLIAYSAADNRWRDVAIEGAAGAPPIDSQYGHIYGQNAIDTRRRRFYHAYHAQGDRPGGVSRLDLATGQWTALPMTDGKLVGGNPPDRDGKPVSITMTGCVEYFTARDGLVMLGEKGLRFFSEERQTWENLGPVAVCGNHSLARHNPVRREVLMMGGNMSRRAVARLDADGKVERLKDAPVDLGVRHEKLTVDPVSGKYLVLVGVDRKLYQFDSAADEWRLVDDFTKTDWPFGRYDMPVVTPVPEHGVTMWVASRVWLYRHSPAEAKARSAGAHGIGSAAVDGRRLHRLSSSRKLMYSRQCGRFSAPQCPRITRPDPLGIAPCASR